MLSTVLSMGSLCSVRLDRRPRPDSRHLSSRKSDVTTPITRAALHENLKLCSSRQELAPFSVLVLGRGGSNDFYFIIEYPRTWDDRSFGLTIFRDKLLLEFYIFRLLQFATHLIASRSIRLKAFNLSSSRMV